MKGGPRHLSSYTDRLEAAQIASAILMAKRTLEPALQQALEDVALQRDMRLDVLAWVRRMDLETQIQGGVNHG